MILFYQIPSYLSESLKALFYQGISPVKCSNSMHFPLFLALQARIREFEPSVFGRINFFLLSLHFALLVIMLSLPALKLPFLHGKKERIFCKVLQWIREMFTDICLYVFKTLPFCKMWQLLLFVFCLFLTFRYLKGTPENILKFFPYLMSHRLS